MRKQLLPLSIDLPDQSQDCSLHQIHCPLRDIGSRGLRAGQADEGGAACTLKNCPHSRHSSPDQALDWSPVVIAIEAIQVNSQGHGMQAVLHVPLEIMEAYAPGQGSGLGAGLISRQIGLLSVPEDPSAPSRAAFLPGLRRSLRLRSAGPAIGLQPIPAGMVMVERAHNTIMEGWAGEVALIDHGSAVALQVGQQALQMMMPLPALPGGQGGAAVEHVVVGVYPQGYQAAFAAEEFHKPVGQDLIVGIDDDGSDPVDIKLHMGEAAGNGRHQATPGHFRVKITIIRVYCSAKLDKFIAPLAGL